MKMNGPVAVEIKVFLIAEDPKNRTDRAPVGVVSLPLGQIPTKADIDKAIEQFKQHDMPIDYRPMTKQEFWDYQTRKMTGEVLPLEGEPDFEN